MSSESNNYESDTLSSAPTDLTAPDVNPFSIAKGAKPTVKLKRRPAAPVSIVSDRPIHQKTRHFNDRLPVVPPKNKPAPKRQRSQTILAKTPVYTANEALAASDDEPIQSATTRAVSRSTSQTTSSASSVVAGASKERKKRSDIHNYVTTQMVLGVKYFQCNYCTQAYKTSEGTGKRKDHLRRSHNITSAGLNEAKRAVWDESVAVALSRQP